MAAPIFSSCDCGTETPTDKPVIGAFTATPMTVDSGQKASIAWSVTNATEISIVATPGGTLIDKSDKASGTVDSPVITGPTMVTLTAINAAGSATRTLTINVTQANEVAIVTFTGMPATIKPGDDAMLTYEVTNATRVTIAEVNGATLRDTMNEFMGTLTVSPTVTTSYVITAEGNGGPKTNTVSIAVEGTPVISNFTATPQMINAGEMSTLSWSVLSAATVLIRDSANNEVFNGPDLTGTRMVSPTANETYTLTATSMLGQVVTQTVMITVNSAAEVISFRANPSVIDYGDTSTLEWEVARSTTIEISANNAVITMSMNPTGIFVVTATATTDYFLTARNAAGDAMAMTTLTVNPTIARITSFAASPNPAAIGSTSDLSWAVVGATQVTIVDQAGNSIYDGVDATGTVTVQVDTSSVTYTLTAINPFGNNTAVEVLVGENNPAIVSFTANPPTFAAMNADITLDWSTTDALSTTLTINGALVAMFPGTPSGSFTFTATSSVNLELTASNDVGSAVATAHVVQLAVGIENGNDATTAQPLPGDGGGVGAELGAAGDIDFYSVVVPDNGNIWAQTSDGLGGCATDTVITLYGADGTTSLGSNNNGGTSPCSLIDPVSDAYAANLPAGTYYVAVSGGAAATVGPYVLLVRVEGPRCGNRINERGAGEQCDDGNVSSSDGCDGMCQIEADGTLMGPGVTQSFMSSIASVGQQRWYQVDMLADGYIRVETFVPTRGRCDTGSGSPSSDMFGELFDGNFTLLGSDNNDGIGSCVLMDPSFDAFTRVTAGTYWVRITENGNNALVSDYEIEIRTLGIGCGNGVVEMGEECEDGNTVSGDGCSNLCAFEGNREVEPNNAFGTATPIVGNSAVVIGSITPLADVDFWSVTVPAGYHLDAYLTVNSLDTCPSDATILTGRLQLLGTNGTSVLATNTIDGPAGNCGRIWPYTDDDSRAMAAGTYYIRVNESGDNAMIGLYYLHVRLLAPGCGNEILETGEQCEDTNTANGDGCSSTCTFEPVVTLTLPFTGDSTVSGSIDPVFNKDAIRLEVTATSYVRAETFEPNAAAHACPTADTVVRLLGADGLTELGQDDESGIGSCSLIDPNVEDFARLDPGTYFLSVEQYLQRRTIFSYDLVVRGTAADVCGNAVVETALNEQCDDGNSASGDGCDAGCQIEPDGIVAGPPGTTTFSGDLTPAGDVDIYRIDATGPAIIVAETFAPTVGMCVTTDTVLRLFDSTGTQIASNDNIDFAGGNLCSRVDGRITAGARVNAGTYFLSVEDYLNDTVIPAYQLDVQVLSANICGNGVTEAANMEICDDGNATAGDGCNNCQPEPLGTLVGLGVQVFMGAIDPANDTDYFRIDVAGPSLIHAETGAPTFGVCATADTYITLLDTSGAVLAFNDDRGGDFCSLIDPVNAAGARVAAGTYYISVHSYNFASVISPYEIELEVTPGLVCGNGVVEAGEACDDGNTTAGDGCNATCALEGVFIAEVEPNNTPVTATSLGTLGVGDVDATGGVTPIGDNDFFTFTLTATQNVLIGTYAAPNGFLTTCGFDSTMWLYNGVPTNFTATAPAMEPTLVEYDDDDGFGACSLISGSDTTPTRRSLNAGTYYVQVRRYADSATIPQYYLRVSVQ